MANFSVLSTVIITNKHLQWQWFYSNNIPMTLSIIYNRMMLADCLINICGVISSLYTPPGTQTSFLRLQVCLGHSNVQDAEHPHASFSPQGHLIPFNIHLLGSFVVFSSLRFRLALEPSTCLKGKKREKNKKLKK